MPLATDSSELDFCTGLVCRPASLFSVSHRFSRPGIRDSLIALKALLEEIGRIPVRVSDPGVAMAKIAWWHQELQPGKVSESEHPVVRALSGAEAQPDPALLKQYLLAVAEFANGEALISMDDLRTVAMRIGGLEASMEASLGRMDNESRQPALQSIGGAFFLDRFVREPEAMLGGQYWWLPMDLQARFGIGQADLQDSKAGSRVIAALDEVVSMALSLVSDGRRELLEARNRARLSPGEHHIVVSSRLLEHRLALNEHGTVTKKQKGHVGIREVFRAWREAVRA